MKTHFFPEYRFFFINTCADEPVRVQCYPHNFQSERSYKWARENDNIFYRKSLEGPLRFHNIPGKGVSDFSFLKNIYDNFKCCEIKFIVEKKCGGEWVEDWGGYFAHNDGDWDFDKCVVSINFHEDDEYRCLLENGDKEINILEITDRETVQLAFESVYDSYIDETLDEDCIFPAPPSDPGYVSIFIDCIIPNTSLAREIWIRERTIQPCIDGVPVEPIRCGGFAWQLVEDNCALNGTATWVRFVDTNDVIMTTCSSGVILPPGIPPGDDISEYIIIFQDCQWYDENDGIAFFYKAPCLRTYTRTITNSNVIEKVVTETCSDVQGVISNFFEINPVNDNPNVPYNAGENYVIEFNNAFFGESEDTTNYYASINISQKSDISNPLSTNPATVGNMTFIGLMDIFREMFNVYWFIDNNGFLRLEHYLWFRQSQILDLTVGKASKMNQSTNEVSYNKSQIPKREIFQWMESYNPDFVGVPIIYSSPCAVGSKEKTVNHLVENVTTDIDYIIDYTAQIKPDGFVFFILDPLTNLILQSVGKITGTLQNNSALGWANLHFNFYRHDRYLIEGSMNNVSTLFASAKRSRKQTDQIYQDCCFDLDPFLGLVLTSQGEGEVEEAEFDIQTNKYTFKLLYQD